MRRGQRQRRAAGLTSNMTEDVLEAVDGARGPSQSGRRAATTRRSGPKCPRVSFIGSYSLLATMALNVSRIPGASRADPGGLADEAHPMTTMSRFYSLLGVSPLPAHRFVISPFLSLTVVCALRLLLTTYTALTLIIALSLRGDASRTTFSYFTWLSYWGLLGYFVAASIYSLLSRARPERQAGWSLLALPRPLQAAHYLLFSSIRVYPVLVMVIFWSILAGGNVFSRPVYAWEVGLSPSLLLSYHLSNRTEHVSPRAQRRHGAVRRLRPRSRRAITLASPSHPHPPLGSACSPAPVLCRNHPCAQAYLGSSSLSSITPHQLRRPQASPTSPKQIKDSTPIPFSTQILVQAE